MCRSMEPVAAITAARRSLSPRRGSSAAVGGESEPDDARGGVSPTNGAAAPANAVTAAPDLEDPAPAAVSPRARYSSPRASMGTRPLRTRRFDALSSPAAAAAAAAAAPAAAAARRPSHRGGRRSVGARAAHGVVALPPSSPSSSISVTTTTTTTPPPASRSRLRGSYSLTPAEPLPLAARVGSGGGLSVPRNAATPHGAAATTRRGLL
jgi:hypothetical protein